MKIIDLALRMFWRRSVYVAFYVPGSLDTAEARYDRVLKELSRLFGGATASSAGIGGYIRADNGQLDKENITIVSSFVESKAALMLRYDDLIAFARSCAKQWDQECILIDLNGRAVFV